jgi:uncharacterized protein (TIGR03067 family)
MNSRATCRVFLGVLAAGLCAAGPGDDVDVKNELKRHQGTWTATSSTFDGQKAADDIVRSIQRIVTDDHVVWERNGKRFAGTRVILDPTTKPASIDVIPDGGRSRGEHILGIYKFDGDALTICMAAPGKPRPSKLAAEKGSGCTLQTFTHEKATKAP